MKNCFNKQTNKPFKINDMFIYLLIFTIILALFLSFVIIPKSNDSDGFIVYKGEQKVLTCSYDKNNLQMENNFTLLVETKESEQGLYIKIYTDEKKEGFNLIFVDFSSSCVKMEQATCSHSKDCTKLPAIKNSGAIYCAPHNLKIVPLKTSHNLPAWTGGI